MMDGLSGAEQAPGGHETAGLARVGGRDADAHQIDEAYTGRPLQDATHPQAEGIGVDPVADDHGAHSSDPGWYDLSGKFDQIARYRYAGPSGASNDDGSDNDGSGQ